MVKQENLTVEHILVIMRALGRFHAVSFAVRDQDPEKFWEIVKNLKEIFFVRGGPLTSLANEAEKVAIECIDDDNDAYLLRAMLQLYEKNQYDQLVDLIHSNECEPYAVMLHGDLWTNNLMFTQDDETGGALDVCLIDWQTVRYGSPGMDYSKSNWIVCFIQILFCFKCWISCTVFSLAPHDHYVATITTFICEHITKV